MREVGQRKEGFSTSLGKLSYIAVLHMRQLTLAVRLNHCSNNIDRGELK
jgi:hypothetical protein